MEAGREAAVIEGLVGPYIRDRIETIVKLMVSEYRGGTATYASLLGRTAEISALMGILSDLDSTQAKGDAASEREFANGRPTKQ
jgi:hypothetical protein